MDGVYILYIVVVYFPIAPGRIIYTYFHVMMHHDFMYVMSCIDGVFLPRGPAADIRVPIRECPHFFYHYIYIYI